MSIPPIDSSNFFGPPTTNTDDVNLGDKRDRAHMASPDENPRDRERQVRMRNSEYADIPPIFRWSPPPEAPRTPPHRVPLAVDEGLQNSRGKEPKLQALCSHLSSLPLAGIKKSLIPIPDTENLIGESYVHSNDESAHLLLQDLSGMRSGQLALTMLALDVLGIEKVAASTSKEDYASNFNIQFPRVGGLIAFAKHVLNLSDLTSIVYEKDEGPEERLMDDLNNGPALVCRMQKSVSCNEWILITPLDEGFLIRQPNHGCAHHITANQLRAAFTRTEITVIKQI